MNNANSTKLRIKYIDIAKGILICCLLYGHMLLFARMEGMNDSVMRVMQKSIPLYNCFFMQTFFFITGFCSSFNKEFKLYLWRNIKSLIIPSIILVTLSEYVLAAVIDQRFDITPLKELSLWFIDGGPWFIITLFWGKILFYFINRLKTLHQIILLVVLYLLGIALNILDWFPNYWYHRHVLLMLPYLFLGHYCKNHPETMSRYLFPMGLFGIISIVLQFIISQCGDFYKLPIHDYHISINRTFYIHIINAVTGSAFVIWLSQRIRENRFLETMGKGTLLVYLWNELINRLVLRIPYIQQFYNSNSILSCIVFHLLVFSLLLIVFYLLIKLVYGSKYLSWMVGKW